MPARPSSTARIQRVFTLGLLALAAGWCVAWWDRSLPVAIGGPVMLWGGHALVLAAECLAMLWLNRSDPAPHARAAQVLRAWLRECATAPRVFCWRQPFRSQAVADFVPQDGHVAGAQGVVLVHGLACNRGFWIPWMRLLTRRGQPFVAVNLEPLSAPLDRHVPTIEAAVARITAATGRPPVLVGHSMGGLVVRAWLRAADDDRRVARVVTIGSPHQGAWLAHWSRGDSAVQMRIGSDWLRALAASESPARRMRFTCWYSNCDHVVFPASSATLQGACNRFVAGLPHVSMAFDRRVMDAVLDEQIQHPVLERGA